MCWKNCRVEHGWTVELVRNLPWSTLKRFEGQISLKFTAQSIVSNELWILAQRESSSDPKPSAENGPVLSKQRCATKKLGPAKRVSHDVKCLNMSKYVQICLNAWTSRGHWQELSCLSSTESKSSQIRSVLRLLRVSVKLPERALCEHQFLKPSRDGLSEFSGRIKQNGSALWGCPGWSWYIWIYLTHDLFQEVEKDVFLKGISPRHICQFPGLELRLLRARPKLLWNMNSK